MARTELVDAEDEDRLVDLEAKDLGLDEGQRLAVDLNEALASLVTVDVSIVFVGSRGRWGCGSFRTLQWATAVAVFFLPNCASPCQQRSLRGDESIRKGTYALHALSGSHLGSKLRGRSGDMQWVMFAKRARGEEGFGFEDREVENGE